MMLKFQPPRLELHILLSKSAPSTLRNYRKLFSFGAGYQVNWTITTTISTSTVASSCQLYLKANL